MRQGIEEFAGGGFSVYEIRFSIKRGSPKKLDFKQLDAVVTVNPATTAKGFAEKFNVTHAIVQHQVKRIGKVLAIGKWVPQTYSQ